jgi:hypothetical protein
MYFGALGYAHEIGWWVAGRKVEVVLTDNDGPPAIALTKVTSDSP